MTTPDILGIVKGLEKAAEMNGLPCDGNCSSFECRSAIQLPAIAEALTIAVEALETTVKHGCDSGEDGMPNPCVVRSEEALQNIRNLPANA